MIEPQVVSWPELIGYDHALGWKPKPGLDTHCVSDLGGDVFHVATDSHGWAGEGSIGESQVVVFGDSFAFGFGVNARSSFSAVNPALRVKAIGAPGYNLVQELLLMRQFTRQLRGKLVVWFIYVGNDLCENLQHNMQERTDGIFGNTFLTERIYSACDYLISEGREICREAGAKLVVMTIPITAQLSAENWSPNADRNPNLPDEKIGAICSRLGVGFVAAKDHLRTADYIPGEGHWNERGHKRIAAVLQQLYAEHSRGGTAPMGHLDREASLTPTLHGEIPLPRPEHGGGV
jgi:hypothetical protein